MKNLSPIVASWLLLTGCSLASQAAATTVAVSTVLTTPAVEVAGGAIAGGGAVGFTVPPQQLVAVFLGERVGTGLELADGGLVGATVTLTRVGGASWQLIDQGQGTYGLPAASGFSYEEEADYDFTFLVGGVTYRAEVLQVPGREHVPAFHPDAGYVLLDAGQPFVFRRPDPLDNLDLPLGLVEVIPVAPGGARSPTSYTNLPRTALGLLKLVAAPGEWKQSLVTVPGTAFPEPDRNYVVLLQSAKLGGPKSDNLFLGSPVLAGTADVAIIRTRP
jgi:hypothetical protein